jgi:hypothetical protein
MQKENTEQITSTFVQVQKENTEQIISAISTAIQEEDYSDAPFYSTFLKEHQMVLPYEQYYFYMSVIGGTGYMMRSLYAAHHLSKYAEAVEQGKDQATIDKHRYALAFNDKQLNRARYYRALFTVKGIAGAIGVPMMMIGWIWSKYGKPLMKRSS